MIDTNCEFSSLRVPLVIINFFVGSTIQALGGRPAKMELCAGPRFSKGVVINYELLFNRTGTHISFSEFIKKVQFSYF